MDESNTATEAQIMTYNPPGEFQRQLQEMISKESLDFDTWISLIAYIEDCYLDDTDTISLVYESFLSKFPLCHVYWKKYADHKTRLCTVKKAVDIYERAVQAAAYCVSLWVDYCTFSTAAFEDPYDIRRLFDRGVSFVGKDYLCHALWDKYIEFECSQNQQSSLLTILIQTLRFPTKKLHEYYNNFKKLAAILDEEREGLNTSSMEVQAEALPCAIMSKININKIIENMQDPANDTRCSQALQKYLATGEQLYHKACQLEETVHRFETSVGRSFFDVKPLDDMQLANWHSYLDFIEKQNDFDWTVQIYEKCLIPCANYPEFWMRYVEFMETKGGRELANFALERATQIFLENAPVIHIFNARFREHIGDVHGARAAFFHGDENSNVYFVENVVKAANMEKRLGHMAAASSIYENALNLASERQKLHTVPVLYIHYSRLKYLIAGSANDAIDVILDGIRHVPRCRLLLEELIKLLMMHEGSKYMTVVDSIIADAITSETVTSESLSTKDRENLSCLYLEYVDLCGTTDDIRNAWNRHIKLFPHLIRTAATNKNPNATHQLLDMAKEVRTRLPLNQLPKGHVSGHLIQIPVVEQELLPSQNHGILSDQVVAEKLPNECGNSAQETEQLPLGIQALSRDNIAEVESKRKFLLQSEDDVSEAMESTHNGTCAPKIVKSELIRFTEDIAKKSEQASCGSQKSIQEFEQSTVVITPSEFLQQSSSSSDIQEMEENERKKHLKPTQLERITQSSQKTQDITSVELQEHALSQKSVFSDRQILEFGPSDEIHDMSNMKSSSVANSVTIENNAHNNNVVKVSSLTTGQSPTQTQTELQSDQPANSGQNCAQDSINTTPTDRSLELHDHKCPQDVQQHISIKKECSTRKMSTYVSVEGFNQGGNQSPLGADLGNVTSDANSVKYVETHVSARHSELSPQHITTHPQALVSHCSTQTNETQGPIESSQQHNQMLQYQQQEQEQMLLHQQYQNQMLQLQHQYFQLQQKNQQLYQHQQHIQPPTQQIQHHHYLDQTQQLQQPSYQLEQHQYLFYQQQQQLQAGQQELYTQLLGQEHQPQQNVLQQNQQGYQLQQQPYQMQQQEAFQQQNLQQQQAYYQQFLQQQNVQQQQAYHQLLQQQLITHDQSNSSYPQGQGIAVLSDGGAAGVSESHKHPFSEGTPEPHKEA